MNMPILVPALVLVLCLYLGGASSLRGCPFLYAFGRKLGSALMQDHRQIRAASSRHLAPRTSHPPQSTRPSSLAAMPAPTSKTNGVSAGSAAAPKKPSRNQLKRDKKKARKHAAPESSTTDGGGGESTTDAESSVGGTDTESEMDFELEVSNGLLPTEVSRAGHLALRMVDGRTEGRWRAAAALNLDLGATGLTRLALAGPLPRRHQAQR